MQRCSGRRSLLANKETFVIVSSTRGKSLPFLLVKQNSLPFLLVIQNSLPCFLHPKNTLISPAVLSTTQNGLAMAGVILFHHITRRLVVTTEVTVVKIHAKMVFMNAV
jgi:hypothetical protein